MILNLILPLQAPDAEGGHGVEELGVDVEAGDDDWKA